MRRARLGRGGEASRPVGGGERRCGEAEPLLARVLNLPELVADHELLHRRQDDRIDDRLHEEAIAGVGRDPARGGVRMGEQPARFEVGENVPDGRTRHTEAVALHEGVRANGGRGGHVFIDDGPEDRLCAGIQ